MSEIVIHRYDAPAIPAPARPGSWMPVVLFRLGMALSACLAGIVLVAPFVTIDPGAGFGSRLLELLACDPLVRRTAVVSAVGIYLTSVICFRRKHAETPISNPVKKEGRSSG